MPVSIQTHLLSEDTTPSFLHAVDQILHAFVASLFHAEQSVLTVSAASDAHLHYKANKSATAAHNVHPKYTNN